MQCRARNAKEALVHANSHSCNALDNLQLDSHNPAHWIDQSPKTTVTGDSTRSKEAASMLVHVVVRQSLAHRVARNAHWMLGRSGQCCSTALVAQFHPGRGAVRGSVTSLINTAKCRCHSSSDAKTLCHTDV